METCGEIENLNGINILLVEDSLDNQDIITYFLTHAGAKVEIAENGLVGVRKALEGNFDIILMDVQMPQLDGYQATLRLRSAGYARPIIALTAHALKEERNHSLRIGCTDHMTKPVDRHFLVKQVAHFARVASSSGS